MNWLLNNRLIQWVIVILIVGGLLYVTGVNFGITAGIGSDQFISWQVGRHK